MENTINFQELFKGFQKTPLLWKTSAIYDLEQFCPDYTRVTFFETDEHKTLRLGKWVEKFVSFQLKRQDDIRILEENIQIKNNNITIGELDLLLLKEKQPIHLEIIYKFYLYEASKDENNTLNHWVGPNQNDALIYKLQKLKEKQLPLLYHPKTKSVLQEHSLDSHSFKQHVCFKAQLFLPYANQNIEIAPLNSNSVVGMYLNFENIDVLKDFQFYIPKKLEWLCLPKEAVDWLFFNDAKNEIKKHIDNKRSPLCWIKNKNNELQKCFITWW